MKIEKKHKSAFFVVGIKTETTNTKESDPETALIPGMWQQFFSENIESQILNKTEAGSILGVYWNYDGDTEKSFSMIAGREVSSLSEVPRTLVGIEVPESDYLVFSQEGEMPEVIYTLWESIRAYFYQNLEVKRKYSYDFESYNSDGSSSVNIYISINA